MEERRPTPRAVPEGVAASFGLGVASTVVGSFALFLSLLPICADTLAFPVSFLGGAFAIAGSIVSLFTGRRGAAFLMAGLVLNASALGMACFAHSAASRAEEARYVSILASKAKEEERRRATQEAAARARQEAEEKRRDAAKWLNPLRLEAGQVGEFPPETPWEFRRLLAPNVAVVGHAKDEFLAVIVKNEDVTHAPDLLKMQDSPVQLRGRWRVARREMFDAYRVFALERE